ncbi:MAG: hypothetical protein AVDCRST_MAG67-2184 [uncultured Solirubrobacteraceae bacterium]|uniref:Blue (type 1) copper domain-containing protein n=1 Tax=uncultured Solirubrobacteraceae bacterium TaxID=1162706 RepID=A0A6J4S5E2_9ACTN|nr:MAG: hypothetical protein AVDCRST_MAG67-2184 [uncultured Solirubrobacteraceae bacterium]
MSKPLSQRLDRGLALLGAALIVATGVVFVAHDGAPSAAETQRAASPAKAIDAVQIKTFLYEPAAITVPVGTKITFTNEDSAPHTATSGPSPNPDGVFDTDILKKGQSTAVKLTKAGTFAYYCTLHPFMKATVTVR